MTVTCNLAESDLGIHANNANSISKANGANDSTVLPLGKVRSCEEDIQQGPPGQPMRDAFNMGQFGSFSCPLYVTTRQWPC